MNVGAWLKGHKPEAGLAGAGIAVTLFLAYRARKDAASGTSSSLLGGTTSTAVPVSTADTTSSDAFNGIENQVLGLQQALLGIQNPPASGTAATPATPSAAAMPLVDGFAPLTAPEAAADVGPNYGDTSLTTPVYYLGPGGNFDAASPAQLPGLVGAGSQLYESPGEFANVPASQYTPASS